MRLFLGLDMATHNSGVALIDQDEKLIDHINIYGGDGDIYDRCNYIYDQLTEFIKKYKEIKYAALEDTLLNKFVPNLNSCRDLITLKGYVLSLMHVNGIKVDIWTPNKWKSWSGVSDNGTKTRNLQKARAIEIVNDIYKIEVDDNQSDAILLALCECQYCRVNNIGD